MKYTIILLYVKLIVNVKVSKFANAFEFQDQVQ